MALALLVIGVGRLIGTDELLIAFAAGAAFVQVVSADEREEEDHGQEAVNRFFSVPTFAVVGVTIPWEGWGELGWRGVALAVMVLLLRRPPMLLLLRPWIRTVHGIPDALFLGWFGPIAVAAVYYASLVGERLELPVLWPAVSLVVCASVVAHGLTGVPLTKLFGRTAGQRADAPAERRATVAARGGGRW